jgi:hypothetical protein
VREVIADALRKIPEGRIMRDDELKELRAHFPDGRFGELIFLLDEGVLLVPSHMGERPIRAMHGYHPSAPQSYAALFTNQEPPESIRAIPHIYNLMTREAAEAVRLNRPGASTTTHPQPELVTA